jgi:hypothetical protein
MTSSPAIGKRSKPTAPAAPTARTLGQLSPRADARDQSCVEDLR